MTNTLTKPADDVSLAPVVEALHVIYREHLAPAVKAATGLDLLPALFVVKRDARAWGHITVRPAWETSTEDLDTDYAYGPLAVSIGAPMTTTVTRGFHEIMVSGENLARGARAVFGTVAHEAAHAANIAAGVRDVDLNGRHNKKFKAAAEDLFGLTITEAKGIGWSVTEVGDECAARWADAISILSDAISASAPREGFGLGGFGVFGGPARPKTGAGSRGGQGRDKNLKKATCGCGSSIRTSLTALAKGITCGGCGEAFTVAE
jgi:hypothetical protein